MSPSYLPSLFAGAVALAAGVAVGRFGHVASAGALAVGSAALLLMLVAPGRTSALIAIAALGLGRDACARADETAAFERIDVQNAAEPRWHTGVIDGPVLSGSTGYRTTLSTADSRLALSVAGEGILPLPGDRVRAWGRLSTEPRYLTWGVGGERDRLAAAGVAARLVTGADRVEIVESGARATVWRPAARAQRRIAAIIAARGARAGERADGAAVVNALVTGDRSSIGGDLETALRRAGIGHLLAISGLHIGALAWLVFAAIRRSAAAAGAANPELAAAAGALLAAAGYALVSGGRPSALRALLVVAVLLAGRARALRPRLTDALGAAATLLLAARPALVADPSFQMSFGAAAVLSVVFSGRRPSSNGRLARIAALIEASAWATAATAPAAVAMFGELAPAALITNVVAVPLVALLILPLAMIGCAASLVAPALGAPLLDVAVAVADLACAASHLLASRVPPIDAPSLSAAPILSWIAAVAVALIARRRRQLRLAAIAALLAAVAVIGASLSRAPDGLRITFVDVGQGDAALVELPGGEAMLVDTGGLPGGRAVERRRLEAPGARALLPLLRHRGVDHLAVVALSHPHPDHHGGLGALVGAVDIGEVWLVTDRPLPPQLDATLRALRVLGTRVRAPPPETSIGGVTVEVLAPRYFGRVAADPVSAVNDNSLVIAVGFSGRRVLFTGDVEADGEELLLGDRPDRRRARLRADVVKVAHHGSATSSSQAFVDATGATHAVISCGRQNRFGFPAAAVVRRWLAAGAEVHRTDVSGSIELSIDRGGGLALRAHSPVGYSR